MTQISTSEEETLRIAGELARSLPLPAHVLLYGDLGAGKTLFSKGLAAGFGVEDPDDVTSPTFTLVNEYQGRIKIYHIDLYRIEKGALDGLGLEDILDDPSAAVIIEWAERLGNFPVSGAVEVFLAHVDDHSRKITICFSH